MSLTERAQQQHDRRGCAQRSDAPRRPDRARPRPGHEQPERHAERDRLRPAALDRGQPAECAPRLSVRVPRRAGRRWCPARSTTTRLSVDARHYLPIGDRVVVASRLQLGNISPSANDPGNVPFSKKYFLGGATQPSRVGTIRSQPAQRFGPADRRQQPRGVQRGAARSISAATWARCSSSTAATSGRTPGTSTSRICATPSVPGCAIRRRSARSASMSGYQLNPNPDLLVNGEPQQRRWRIHFSIGQAF